MLDVSSRSAVKFHTSLYSILKLWFRSLPPDRAEAGGGQRVSVIERRRERGRAGVDGLGHKERQILREVGDDAVGGLVGIDSGTRANHGFQVAGQIPGEARLAARGAGAWG